MLKTALTTTALATVLLTSSISANELSTKVEKIGAFDNIPTHNLNAQELETMGEGIIKFTVYGVEIDLRWGEDRRTKAKS